MSSCDVALVREQGVEFAVVCVSDNVVESSSERERAVRAWSAELGRPAVLMGSRHHRFYGRTDIVHFLSRVHYSQLPWRQMIVNG